MNQWCYWMQIYSKLMQNYELPSIGFSSLYSTSAHIMRCSRRRFHWSGGFYFIYFALILHFWGSSCSRIIKNKSSSPLKEKKFIEGRKDHLHLPNPIRHPYPALWRSLSGSEWPPASSSSAPRLAAHSSFTQAEAAKPQIPTRCLVPPTDTSRTNTAAKVSELLLPRKHYSNKLKPLKFQNHSFKIYQIQVGLPQFYIQSRIPQWNLICIQTRVIFYCQK